MKLYFPSILAYWFLPFSYDIKKKYIVEADPVKRSKLLIFDMNQELKVVELEAKIESDVEQVLLISHMALTGSNRGDRHNRDMLIDSSLLGVDGTAELIESVAKKVFHE